MATGTSKTIAPSMSDAAVKAKTGKAWQEWFSLLDKAGARKMTHQEIVHLLHSTHGVGPWWTQMVTVTYEQARGLRDKHQKPGGYEISVSRTIEAPVAMLYKSFDDAKTRKTWLPEDGLTARKKTTNKSLRMTWSDNKTILAIAFAAKGDQKCQVVVQHSKLSDAKAAEKMKAYWSKALDRLKAKLE